MRLPGPLFVLVCAVTLTSAHNFQRTIVFLRAQTVPGQNVFIRGGIGASVRPGCGQPVQSDPCSIPIRHRVEPSGPGSSYGAWSQGDNFLDWYGAEPGQGNFLGSSAGGSPMMWTTNDASDSDRVEIDGHGYTNLNRFAPHYWMLDVDMDCSATENGWFEFKAFVTPTIGWEGNIAQYSRCAGSDNERPYTGINHMALCGRLNVFMYERNECNVFDIPANPSLPPPAGCGQRKIWSTSVRSDDSNTFNDISGAIVNGAPATMGRWPWQGVLQYNSVIGGCAAVLIDSLWALTAGHCVTTTHPSILRVRFGEQNLVAAQGTEQAIQVTSIHRHELHGNPPPGHPYNDFDVALLRLSSPVDLSSHVVNTACLPYGYSLDAFVGQNCWATGFGETLGTSEKHRLNEINVPVYSHAACTNIWGSDRVTVRQVCMGTQTESACGGDSGGPLVCYMDNKWTLVGITSWGSSGCQGNPSVYTRVTEFLDWIDGIRAQYSKSD